MFGSLLADKAARRALFNKYRRYSLTFETAAKALTANFIILNDALNYKSDASHQKIRVAREPRE